MNASSAAATLELQFRIYDAEYHLTRPSRKLVLKNGRRVWRVRVPANGTERLNYTIEIQPVCDADEDEEDEDR